jgi:hypothetical protein
MKGRLNLFQSAMLRWRDLHPYSAVHVVRVPAPFDRGRLAAVIAAQLERDGLTGLVLDRAHRRYEFRGGPAAIEFEVITQNGDGERAMSVEIERQLNTPFARDGAIVPFRFFAVPGNGSFRLGLGYDHFIAGGDSIVVLLKKIVDRYAGAPVDRPPPDLYPPTFSPLFARNAAMLVRGLPWVPRIAAACRRGMRPRYADDGDGYNQFVHVELPAPATAALRAKARAWGVTFNDVLLALLFQALAPQLPERRSAARRREIGIASIVNLRKECGLDVHDVFGQFLSSIRVSHPVPPDISLKQLARDIHAETARVKKGKLYLQTLLAVRVNGIVWLFLNARRRTRLYAKTYPVLAGLTSLNIDALWGSPGTGQAPPDYVRAVPTGPLAPLVVAATTSGNTLQLGLSYRRTASLAQKIDKIADSFADCVRSLQ